MPQIQESTIAMVDMLLRESGFESIKLEVSIHQSKPAMLPPENQRELDYKQTYFQTSQGQRYFDDRFTWGDGGGRRTAYCDGKKCANVIYDREDLESQKIVQIGNSFMDDMKFNYMSMPWPLRSYYVGPTRLAEALPSAKRARDATVMGRACDGYLFEDVGSTSREEEFVVQLDHETAVPLRVSMYARVEQVLSEQPTWVWEARDLKLLDGHHFVTSSTIVAYLIEESKDTPGTWTSRRNFDQDIRATSIQVSIPIEADKFWPTLQTGVQVLDEIGGSNYIVGENDRTGSKVPEAIRVPQSEPLAWPTWLGISVSVALLLVAVFLWKKGR